MSSVQATDTEGEFDLAGIVGHFRRRWLIMLIPAVLIALAGVAVAFLLTPEYESKATILIESQQIPTDLVSPTVTANIAERIRVIEQRLLARDNLLDIANKFSLYDYEGANRTPTTIVDNMREAIRITQIEAGTAANRNVVLVGFTVSFTYRNATISSRVANELVSSILAQNLESRLDRATETSRFLQSQKADIEQRLLALETRIAEFKQTNEDAMPDTLTIRRAQLAQINEQILEIDQRLRAIAIAPELGATDAGANRLMDLNLSMQAKQLELEGLQEERDRLAPLAEDGFVPENQIRDLDRAISMAELTIQGLEVQIAAAGGTPADTSGIITLLEEQKTELQTDADRLRQTITRTPVIEIELNSLNRDYENLQSEYRQAQANLEDAVAGERLEEDRQSERFEVIEQATVPTEPVAPDRVRISIFGVLAGAGAGFGLAALLTILDKRVYSAKDIERKLRMKPIAVIPIIATANEQRGRNFKILLLVVLVVGGAVIALTAIHAYYLPLDLLLDRALQKVRPLLISMNISI